MRRQMVIGILISVLLVPALMLAQEENQPITWIGFFKAQPGRGEDFVDLIMENDKPVLDKLRADGTIIAWGIWTPWAHGDDTWTHSLWATMADWGKMELLEKAFEEAEKTRTKEENQKIGEEFRATIVAGSHRDLFLRQIVFSKLGSVERSDKPYLWVGLYKARPGKGDEVVQLYKKFAQPVYERLLEDGTISRYGFNVQSVHSNPEVTHATWYEFNDLSAIDRVRQAFQEAEKKRTKEEQAWLESQFRELFTPGSHRDLIQRSVHHRGAR